MMNRNRWLIGIFISLSFNSCFDDSHLGNNIFYQPMYEAIDVGSTFGGCIFIGKKQGGYTNYKKVLIYSEVISIHQDQNFVYVKQQFDLEGFKFLVEEELRYLNIGRSYLPDEVYELITKDTVIVDTLDIIKKSRFVKDRMNTGTYNYYVLNINDYSIKEFFLEADFIAYLKKNDMYYIFDEL